MQKNARWKIRWVAIATLVVVSTWNVGSAVAGEILVTDDIAVSTTWTPGNTYNLQNQIYVLPGATLTIEAGTHVISDTGGGGSLAVTRGAQLHALGHPTAPIIFTSKADEATWTDGDPKTGVWRESANEWGNVTLMGRGYVSEDGVKGNVPTCDANNVAVMEGLIAEFPGDPRIFYGGGDDDDDSGTLRFLSLRYGGKVIGLSNELNGLSLGGVGRGTDIHHVEIMNNVDDGIEIWGGTVNLSYFSIWNVGDDSLDIDQGWRGKAQFGLIVQGHSLDASQGSGVGDNCFETDGAESSSWQPVTTATIYNCTVIGQPLDGDGATAWRDNARVQYRSCIFMDLGEQVVRFDDVDGDGGQGYGFEGTLSWEDTWSTPFDAVPPHANDCPPGTYQAQSDGNLAEIRDSVFFRNLASNAYTEANARGVFDPSNDNVLVKGTDDAASPIKGLVRGTPITRGGKTIVPVTFLDPRPSNEALTSSINPATDSFFASADYRGAFDPAGPNWLAGWTASTAFNFTPVNTTSFDMKLGNRVVAKLDLKRNLGRTATLVQDGNVICDDVPLEITDLDPLTATFDCGGTLVTITKTGNTITWNAGPLEGMLCLVRSAVPAWEAIYRPEIIPGFYARVSADRGGTVNSTGGSVQVQATDIPGHPYEYGRDGDYWIEYGSIPDKYKVHFNENGIFHILEDQKPKTIEVGVTPEQDDGPRGRTGCAQVFETSKNGVVVSDMVTINENRSHENRWAYYMQTGQPVFEVESVQDAVDQICTHVDKNGMLTKLTIANHALPGQISVGDGNSRQEGKWLGKNENDEPIGAYQTLVEGLAGKFAEGAEICIIGCHVGEGTEGMKLAQCLANDLGVNVKAKRGAVYYLRIDGTYIPVSAGEKDWEEASPE